MSKSPKEFFVGPAVREIRLSRDLTQENLAELAGLSKGFVSQVEIGHRGVSNETVATIADAMDVPASFVFVLADDSPGPAVVELQNLVRRHLDLAAEERKQRKSRSTNPSMN